MNKPEIKEINGVLTVVGGRLDGLRDGDQAYGVFGYGEVNLRVGYIEVSDRDYTLDGMYDSAHTEPVLYFSKPIDPPRPKWMVEKVIEGFVCYVYHGTSGDETLAHYIFYPNNEHPNVNIPATLTFEVPE